MVIVVMVIVVMVIVVMVLFLGAFTWTMQSGSNAHSIWFVSVHMNLLEIHANRMRIAFNPPLEVD